MVCLQNLFTRKILRVNNNTKKAISPVIATILLLAITVIIAMGVFQFLNIYTQDQLDQAQSNQISDDFNIRVVDSNSQQSIIQTPFEELNVTQVLLDGFECEGNIGIISGRPLRVNLSSCSQNITTSRPRLTIETEDGIIQQDLRSQELGESSGIEVGSSGDGTSSFSCDDLPGSWIEVPGSSYFGTDDFCVMQFEAKAYNITSGEVEQRLSNNIAGFIPYSSAEEIPWTFITFDNAFDACDNLNTNSLFEEYSNGNSFKMITNRQWMTIARDAEQQSVNWESGEQGVGTMFRGVSNSLPLDGTDSLSGVNTRTLTLSNDQVIWDLSGNVWQWVDLTENGNSFEGQACEDSGWQQFNDCEWRNEYSKNNSLVLELPLEREMGPLGNYDSSNGIGQIYSSNGEHVLFRGGSGLDDDDNVGVYATDLSYSRLSSITNYGFRCAFEP